MHLLPVDQVVDESVQDELPYLTWDFWAIKSRNEWDDQTAVSLGPVKGVGCHG